MSFVDELEQHLTGGIVIDGRRRKRRRRAIVSVATVVVAGLMALGGWTILTDEPSTQVATDVGERTPTTPTATGEASDPTLPVPGPDPVDDEARPDAAQRSLEMVGTVTVWTGSELFVWGGATTYEAAAMPDNPGIRYEPTSDTWRELPPAPGGPQTEAVGVWTGSEVIVCCGRTTDGVGGDGGGAVAYRPDTDNWRELAEPPLDQPAGAVWLDGRMYVISRFVMAAYDPGTDTWERLAAPPSDTALSTRSPIIAVDDAIVVWPLRPSRTVSEGMVYDPTTDTWSMLPSPPDGYHPAMTDVAWTGEELIVVGGLPAPFADDSERLVGARLDWATKTWTPLPDV